MITYQYKECHKARVDTLILMHDRVMVKRAQAMQRAQWKQAAQLRLLEVRIVRVLHRACISIEGL